MPKIHLLPDLLVNQIAAGEVIQRPSSVVKELLDNAIDAESNHIKLIIKEAGRQLIQVIDDGIGMDEADSRRCFEKHATSKITTTDDLFKIQTMGFRGEAMASIAAVAQVEMESCLRGATMGSYLSIEGAQIKKQLPIATAAGTKVSVKNLFYNLPARRSFLKSNPVEFKHILEEVQRAALAQPSIGFTLYHNGTEIYKLSSEKPIHRIIHLFGDHYKTQLLPCKETTDIVTITGYIGKPDQAKKTRGEQFLFVNNRFIKSTLLNHAIKHAYGRCLPVDSFPFYTIYFTLDPHWIDVNVHPTKTEIKFQDDKTIYALLQAVVKKSLAMYHTGDILDFEQNVNNSLLRYTHPIMIKTNGNLTKAEKHYAAFKTVDTLPTATTPWDNLFQPLLPSQPAAEIENYTPEAGQAIQLYASYIVTEIQSGMLLIDQQAAHERILYDKFSNHFQNKSGASQQLMIPEQLTLNPTDYMVLLENKETLRRLGFIIDAFGRSTIIIHGFPADLNHHLPKQLLEGLIEQFKWNDQLLPSSEHCIRALAKRASITHGTKLHAVEIDALLAQLFSCSNTLYTPDGKKICIIVNQEKLIELLK